MHKQLLNNYKPDDFDIIHAHNLFNGGISAYYSLIRRQVFPLLLVLEQVICQYL